MDRTVIHKRTIYVNDHIIAYKNIFPAIAVERRIDLYIFSDGTE